MSKKEEQELNENGDVTAENAENEAPTEENERDAEERNEQDALIEEQYQRIQELEEEVKNLKDAQLRRTAEMDNMRKRLNKERVQTFENARKSALEEFLPINDDLLRTLKAMEEADADKTYLDGVRLVADKFDEVLKKYDVERIDEEGVPFDVDLHDAMLRQKPEDESIDSEIVLKILENGYRIGDKTLRHAKVIVSE